MAPAGTLGAPIGDETYDGDVISQKFTGGSVSYNNATKAFTTDPPDLAANLAGVEVPSDATTAINQAWRAAGGLNGELGARQGAQYAVGDNGAAQDYARGKVFYSPATGAHAVTGAILSKYDELGGPKSDLGLPVGTEADGGAPNSRVSAFSAPDKPVIFWTPDNGAIVVRGAINAAWDKLGGATGTLGVPTGEEKVDGRHRHADLQRRRDLVQQGHQLLQHQAAGTGRIAVGDGGAQRHRAGNACRRTASRARGSAGTGGGCW